MIFANKTAAAVWKENHCDRCFQPDQAEQRLTGRGRGCMILNAAMVTETVPVQLTEGRAGAMMAEAFRCNEFADKPTSTRPRPRLEAEEVAGLFDVPVSMLVMDADHS